MVKMNGQLSINMNIGFSYLKSLPELPEDLDILDCDNNFLKEDLPNSIWWLSCNENKISSLTDLPLNLKRLFITGNPLVDISGIWKCKYLSVIWFDQENLYDEIKTFCSVNNLDLIKESNHWRVTNHLWW